jgi:DNA-binding MarR family transcriptional regulator
MSPEQEHVGVLIGAARRGIKQAVLRLARPLRLTPPQFWFLNAARELPGASLGTLARQQHMAAPTASRVAEGLERRGLLRLEPDALDRRTLHVQLTAAGLRLAQRVDPLVAGVRGAVVQGMSPREEQALRRSLRKVLKNLETLGGGQ